MKSLILILAAILALATGGMAWHHHKYHWRDKAQVQHVDQSQKYKLSDDETRLRIYQDLEEKGKP
jgi:hypothetical protein